MNVLKSAAVVAVAFVLAAASGCSTVSDMHSKAEAKRANPSESFVRAHEFQPKLDPMGWGESNQNGQ